MITYVSKGRGLTIALDDAGFSCSKNDNVFQRSNPEMEAAISELGLVAMLAKTLTGDEAEWATIDAQLLLDAQALRDASDAEVQVIIDAYDPLPYERASAKARFTTQFNEITSELQASFPEAVKLTFVTQEAQAREFLLNGTIGSTLQALMDGRGLTATELSIKIVDKANAYQTFVDTLNGRMQALEDAVEIETDWKIISQTNLVV